MREVEWKEAGNYDLERTHKEFLGLLIVEVYFITICSTVHLFYAFIISHTKKINIKNMAVCRNNMIISIDQK